ncbi:MAG: hypothetical protein WAM14_13955 [Candidatus Nitrosopolaris sp.]
MQKNRRRREKDKNKLGMLFRLTIYGHIFRTELLKEVPIPAGASSENEEAIWNALICQYMCKDNKENFCKTEFLQAIINGKIQMPHAYELNEIKKAIDDDKHYYNTLISNVLHWMITSDLLKKPKDEDTESKHSRLWATGRLKMLCPEILKYDMPVIKVLVKGLDDAKIEIRNSKDVSGIISLLQNLQVNQYVDLSKVEPTIPLVKLNQLGVISISLDNQISISALGRKVLAEAKSS